jgi:hypothetical protein
MKKFATLLIAFGAIGGTAACAPEPTPIQQATRALREQCVDPNELRDEARVLEETTVVRVEPVTFMVWSTRQQGGYALGATKLYAIAPTGMSADQMARAAQCHSAKALLSDVDPAALADDPFYLPDTWIDSDVKVEQGLFVVTLTAPKVWQNLAVLRRATAFAKEHAPAPRAY